MPPEVICQLLGSAIDFPAAQNVKIKVVQDKNSPRSLSARGAECAYVDAFRAAMDCVWTGIAGSGKDFFRFDNLYDFRAPRVRLRVDNVDSRRAQSGDDQVPSLKVGMRCVRAERSAANVLRFRATARRLLYFKCRGFGHAGG